MVEADDPPVKKEEQDQDPFESPDMLHSGDDQTRPKQEEHIHAKEDQQAFDGGHYHQ